MANSEKSQANSLNDKDPNNYKENILAIKNKWEGYVPRGENEEWDAINAGVIQLKCFINNICPFSRSPEKESTLIFSPRTWERIKYNLPPGLSREALMAMDGLDGVFFAPKYVYRHNYMFKRKSGSTGIVHPSSTVWYDNFEEIQSYAQKPIAVDQTRYKNEQTWIVEPSVFDYTQSVENEEGGISEECTQAQWRYYKIDPKETTDSEYSFDYIKNVYDKYDIYKQGEAEASKIKMKPVEGKTESEKQKSKKAIEDEYNNAIKALGPIPIERGAVQIPVQTTVYSTKDSREPVHWRVSKKTPIFKGEDFFITFHREAESPAINNQSTEKVPFRINDDFYQALDITKSNIKATISLSGNVNKSTKQRVNAAVVFDENPEKERTNYAEDMDYKAFNFYRKPYYIIEMGYMNPKERYYIILCQGCAPSFVVVEKMEESDLPVSRVLSFCPFIQDSGVLIGAKDFTITVKNHIGKIAILFNGGGVPFQAWVIKKTHIEPRWDHVKREVTFVPRMTTINVPRGFMTIWGGNLKAGFCFGPLQCKVDSVDFVYPPAPLRPFREGEDSTRLASAFSTDAPVPIGTVTCTGGENANCDQGEFETMPFFLPMEGYHNLRFNSEDIYLSDLFKDFVPRPSTNLSNINTNLAFTQGAQYYRNWGYGNGSGYVANNTSWEFGGYLYGDTFVEFSDIDAPAIRKSLLTIRKFRYSNNNQTRQQAFDTLIGMMCGDHVFTDRYWGYWDSDPPKQPTPPPRNPASVSIGYWDIPDSQWLLRSCKSPIMTHLTLYSSESSSTRWDDGTSAFESPPKTPYHTEGSYFIDASDHVMEFSESWSANGFWEVEHIGNLTFYLNPHMKTENNVTEALYALQDKNFYVEIWAGYRGCNSCKTDGFFKLFTGICQGGELSVEYNKHILNCKVVDYTTVLKSVKFFNSPWYDGLKDINAIYDIVTKCGFRHVGKFAPAKLLYELSALASEGTSEVFFHHFDGRPFKFETYALPSGYSRLEQPAFKFQDGEVLYDAIIKIAKRAGKVFYFDQFGIAHYEDLEDMIVADYLGRIPLAPLFEFTSNPYLNGGQLVHNKIDQSYDVEKVANHIKIMTTTPDMHLIIRDRLNWSSLEDPTATGFLGYLKTFYQQEGLFGSIEAVENTVTRYQVMWKPTYSVKFETYGMPLRANDIIKLDGQTLRVIRVNNRLNAQENVWWMEVECMIYQSIY